MEDYKDDNRTEKEIEEYFYILIDLSEGIFHDFKNVLATISGLTQLTLLEPMSEEAKENLNIINNATLEGRELLDRFYNMIKGFDLEKEQELFLGNIIFRALEMTKHKLNTNIGANKIKVDVNLNSSKKIYCNEYKIRQALLNIILNALDAMEKEGGRLKISLFEKDNYLVLEISDTGIGMTKDEQKYIFDSGFTTKGKDGSGLGLRISKNIFEEYGGTISVESKVDYGSKFIIKFPL